MAKTTSEVESNVGADGSFEAALAVHANVHKGVGADERNIINHVLSMPKTGFLGKRRTRILERMERRARNELGLGANEAIDWSTVDWAALFQILIKLLMMFF